MCGKTGKEVSVDIIRVVEVAFIIFMKLCAEPRLFCKDNRPQLLTVLYNNSDVLDKEKPF